MRQNLRHLGAEQLFLKLVYLLFVWRLEVQVEQEKDKTAANCVNVCFHSENKGFPLLWLCDLTSMKSHHHHHREGWLRAENQC